MLKKSDIFQTVHPTANLMEYVQSEYNRIIIAPVDLSDKWPNILRSLQTKGMNTAKMRSEQTQKYQAKYHKNTKQTVAFQIKSVPLH